MDAEDTYEMVGDSLIRVFVNRAEKSEFMEIYIMKLIYNLIMIDKESSYDNHIEGFNIGFFSGYDKAEETAKRYLTEVEGFKDYNVTYKITEKHVIGGGDGLSTGIFIIYGWNENDNFDAVDIIESNCYANQSEAQQALNKLKASYWRKEWCIDKYIIDECRWQEGFVKV
ncbi:MAG: hypothetical protein J1F64_10815 [Oscillospiraceae bacterium]|nr:hypothetical protein [Oscillospiraceae bacterium]